MTDTLTRSQLYLSSIACSLGDSAPIAELPELSTELCDMFHSLGLAHYSRSSEEPSTLAIASAQQTLRLAHLPTSDIGLVVYATNTLATPNHSRDDLRLFCRDLDLQHAFPVGVFSWECSNLYLAIAVAADALRAGRADHVLVVTTDKCLPGEPRILPPNLTVLSDGACSFILSTVPGTHSCFQLGGMGSYSDPMLAQVDPAEQLPEFFRRTVKGVVTATAQAIENGGVCVSDISAIVTNNYNLSIMRTFAIQIGYDINKTYFNNLGRFAHAYAADSLINLLDLDQSRRLAAGDLCLLIASGPTAWGAITMTKHKGPNLCSKTSTATCGEI